MNKDHVKSLRKNMTFAERLLWRNLRNRQLENFKFRRQVPIGRYIVDFVCLEKKLILEIDGGQHAEMNSGDSERDAWFEAQGFKTLRFWNNEVLTNMEGVIEKIRKVTLTPALSRQREREMKGVTS